MPIRWDSLLVRHTTNELRQKLEGTQLRAIRFDRQKRDVLVIFQEKTLVWRLHPSKGHLVFADSITPVKNDYRFRGKLRVVEAPDDERIVRFGLPPVRSGPVNLIIELLGNQWNALITEGDPGVTRHVLWQRTGKATNRAVGQLYKPFTSPGRIGLKGDVTLAEWRKVLGSVRSEDLAATLVRTFAWTSPLNASTLLGTPGGLEAGHAHWHAMATSEPEPVMLDLDSGPQPYPFSLAGFEQSSTESLIAGFSSCTAPKGDRDQEPTVAATAPDVIARLNKALKQARKRARRLEEEVAKLQDPTTLRTIGDLILANYTDIPEGSSVIRLTDFDGSEVKVELRPTDPPHKNAARFYARAKKSERAREQLPQLIDLARAAQAKLEKLLALAHSGDANESEIEKVLGPAVKKSAAGATEPVSPYKVYVSSGGLEIRVGRGAKYNDELTFHNSSPRDVWLHARHSAGAHVILRWKGPGRPPARDLREAATLAALHSKARTSVSVPVDWTLRKYVRKPRKSLAGTVIPDRVETLFVEPDTGLMDALAENARMATYSELGSSG